MPGDVGPSPGRILFGLLVLGVLVLVGLEALTDHIVTELYSEDGVHPRWLPVLPLIRAYLRAKTHVLGHLTIYLPLAIAVPMVLFAGLRWMARGTTRCREALSGMWHRKESYALAQPFATAPEGAVVATRAAWATAMIAERKRAGFAGAVHGPRSTVHGRGWRANGRAQLRPSQPPSANCQLPTAQRPPATAPPPRVVLGLGADREPVYLDDRARSMHVHLLGQTGSGKTQSVIYPLLWQDIGRGAPVIFLDAKGSIENEETLCRIAAACGRSDELKIFSLNPERDSQSYNPIYLTPGADPRAVAERAFSTFADEMDEPFYRMTAAEFFCHLVAALAATGKQICLRDALACLVDEEILAYALSQSSDSAARRQIQSAVVHMGPRFHQQVAGLRVALQRFAHPLLNRYDPDIVLEDVLEGKGIIGFSLSANAYKLLSRSIGMMVLQHLQFLGARRQQNRSLNQRPIYVTIDEFYTFAYEGFIDAVNKLRDANISLLLSHQSMADLDRVSKEYSRGIWDNTRTKIVLNQSDPELCTRLAESVGTRREVKETFRRSADPFLNSGAMLEASTREVDEFVLHPSCIKHLGAVGQAYLVQTGLVREASNARRWQAWLRSSKCLPAGGAYVAGVNLPLFGKLAPAPFPEPKQADESDGLGLWRLLEKEEAA